MSKESVHIVSSESDGCRLDKTLAEFITDSSLRYRRRLCDDGRVLIDGKSRKPGYKVRSGQEIQIQEEADSMSFEELGLSVVEQGDDFAAVFKPGGVHSAAIAGKDSSSVEDVLPEMFPGKTPLLLNRLDCLTSGLLLVAFGSEAESTYHAMEQSGKIMKFYHATVEGRLDGVISVKKALDTDDRKTTRVLDEDDDDSRRWTDIEALAHDHEADTTDVVCLIMKGARHQIRAHLASLGHPIVGDPVYGNGKEGDELKLQHKRVEFDGFSASL